MTSQLGHAAINLIASLGYLGLAIGLIVDSCGIPIPSEILIPLAGASVHTGHFSLIGVVIVGTLAQTVGAVISYWLGAWGGLPLVQRYGKYVLFREHELHNTEALFAKWGSWLTLFGRVIPGIRTYIGYPAGIAKMPFGRFVVATMVGSLVWTITLAELGYQLSDHLDEIDHLLSRFGLIALLLVLALVIWYVVVSNRKRTA